MVLVQYCGMALTAAWQILKTVLLSFIQTVTVLLSIVPVLYVCSALSIMNNFLWLAKQMVHSVELNLFCRHSVFDSSLYNRELSLKNCSILFCLCHWLMNGGLSNPLFFVHLFQLALCLSNTVFLCRSFVEKITI